ncbi:MAG: FGGY-family carbohydrate kinase [Dehalococcoidia bacterium]|nr:MAG: FGGY-family carbohydrate kinase [Dehalococcoidia bacterium]
MSNKYVLAIDAGSSGGRALIFDLHGALISSTGRAWTYNVPEDAGPMGKEFDTEEFWGYICRLIADATVKGAVQSAEIIAVSTSSQRQGVVFLDEMGRELYAGPNTDIRAIIEGFTIDGEFGKEVYEITGHAPSLMLCPAKLHWFKANRPDIYEQIATVLSISDWVAYRLSGQRLGEVSCISSIGLVDVGDLKGSDRLEEMLDLPSGVCPEITTSGTHIGVVTQEAAAQTGLAAGTSVVVGGADSQCALLGMGVINEGQVGIVAGWSGSVQMVTSEPIIDPESRLWTTCHVLPERWILESNAQQCGGAYSWLRETLFSDLTDENAGYEIMERLAEETAPGSGGVLAFIGPAVMDMRRMRLSLGGFIFPVTPSITDIKKEHLIRAALENLAFAFKANCVQLEEISKLKIREVKIGGGLAQSRCLVQILSDVLDMPVTAYDVRHVTSWGTAMCAAVGSGSYGNFNEAIAGMMPESKVVDPDTQRAQEYTQYYRKWLSTADWLDRLEQGIS